MCAKFEPKLDLSCSIKEPLLPVDELSRLCFRPCALRSPGSFVLVGCCALGRQTAAEGQLSGRRAIVAAGKLQLSGSRLGSGSGRRYESLARLFSPAICIRNRRGRTIVPAGLADQASRAESGARLASSCAHPARKERLSGRPNDAGRVAAGANEPQGESCK